MRFADVNGQKIGVVFVVFEDLLNVTNLATERGSRKTPENQNQRPAFGALANMESCLAIEGYKRRVRRLASNLQVSSMHLRQRVAHHADSVLGTPSHISETRRDSCC